MIHVSEAVELLLVFLLIMAGLATMYLLQRWIDGEEGAEQEED